MKIKNVLYVFVMLLSFQNANAQNIYSKQNIPDDSIKIWDRILTKEEPSQFGNSDVYILKESVDIRNVTECITFIADLDTVILNRYLSNSKSKIDAIDLMHTYIANFEDIFGKQNISLYLDICKSLAVKKDSFKHYLILYFIPIISTKTNPIKHDGVIKDLSSLLPLNKTSLNRLFMGNIYESFGENNAQLLLEHIKNKHPDNQELLYTLSQAIKDIQFNQISDENSKWSFAK